MTMHRMISTRRDSSGGTAASHAPLSPLLDLEAVAEPQRGVLWRKAARSYFPGLSITDLRGTPDAGSIEGSEFGLGSIWTLLSPPVAVAYRPRPDDGSVQRSFAVILQHQGTMAAAQQRRHCRLAPGDLCLLDEQWPFELEVRDDISQFTLMRMPRWMIVERYPHIGEHTASLISAEDPGATLLREVLTRVQDVAPFLSGSQGDTALASLVQLLGVLRTPGSKHEDNLGWRVRAALGFIDARLDDAALTAGDVAAAQGVSRRHLDEILLRTTGLATAAQIWRRRLERTAADLHDPRRAGKSVAEIAYDAGFKDAAHFTRAFKKRYGCTPRAWRRRAPLSAIRRWPAACCPAAGPACG